jgi:hypothetical protein
LPWSVLAPATIVPPVLTDFTATATPAGSSAVQRTSSVSVLYSPTVATSWATWLKAAPATPYTVVIGFVTLAYCGAFPSFAIALEESSTGKYVFWEFRSGNGAYPLQLDVGHWTNSTTFSADTYGKPVMAVMPAVWLSVKDDGTNLTFYLLLDGQNPIQMFQESRTAFLAGGPNKIGWGIENGTASNFSYATIVHWTGA